MDREITDADRAMLVRAAVTRVGRDEMKAALARTDDPSFQAPTSVTNALKALRKHRDPTSVVTRPQYRAALPYLAAVLSDACDWRPTDTLPRWSLFKNQNDCSTVTTGPVTEPFWTSGSTAGPWALKPRAPRVPWSIVSESESIASRCST